MPSGRVTGPKQLPALDQQELADVEFIRQLDAEAATMKLLEHDFARQTPLSPGLIMQLNATAGNGDSKRNRHRIANDSERHGA